MNYYDDFCVKVRADFTPEGTILPIKLKWVDADGEEYVRNISKVIDICPGASLKVGVAGTRYTVLIDGKQYFLFFADNKWYFEI